MPLEIQPVRQDEEFGFKRKYKKFCPKCGTHYRSEKPISHDCGCGGKLIKEGKNEN